MNRVFLDTNVLLYAFSMGDPKGERARELLRTGGTISVQCLNEFASVALRKLKMSWQQVTEGILAIVGISDDIVPLDLELHKHGLWLVDRYQVSVFDGMIIAAALSRDCDILYSEDMQNGLKVDGRLQLVNPFA